MLNYRSKMTQHFLGTKDGKIYSLYFLTSNTLLHLLYHKQKRQRFEKRKMCRKNFRTNAEHKLFIARIIA